MCGILFWTDVGFKILNRFEVGKVVSNWSLKTATMWNYQCEIFYNFGLNLWPCNVFATLLSALMSINLLEFIKKAPHNSFGSVKWISTKRRPENVLLYTKMNTQFNVPSLSWNELNWIVFWVHVEAIKRIGLNYWNCYATLHTTAWNLWILIVLNRVCDVNIPSQSISSMWKKNNCIDNKLKPFPIHISMSFLEQNYFSIHLITKKSEENFPAGAFGKVKEMKQNPRQQITKR